MARQLPPALQRFLSKFSKSREFTISFAIHAILAVLFGGSILYQVVQEPSDFTSDNGFVKARVAPTQVAPAPSNPLDTVPTTPAFKTLSAGSPTQSTTVIETSGPSVLEFPVPGPGKPEVSSPPFVAAGPVTVDGRVHSDEKLTKQEQKDIGDFTDWGGKPGPGTGLADRIFHFTAFIGEYDGGDWSSTVRVDPGGKIETGSLPNLLYLMSFWSKEKIHTNYKSVQAIRLDSDEIFKVKPPFIFLTGTRDFVLTDKEAANLRKYIQLGGCVWGDSSVPGLRSRFDLAFRREMKRVLPDVDKTFEPLPSDHPLFSNAYFPQIKDVPAGLNFYQLPVYAMKIHGEIAILYTANDYGDMWQIGLNSTGQIDLSTDEQHRYVAINPTLYGLRDIYARNMTPKSLDASYRFGTNLVIHLLTRWDEKVGRASTSL